MSQTDEFKACQRGPENELGFRLQEIKQKTVPWPGRFTPGGPAGLIASGKQCFRKLHFVETKNTWKGTNPLIPVTASHEEAALSPEADILVHSVLLISENPMLGHLKPKEQSKLCPTGAQGVEWPETLRLA